MHVCVCVCVREPAVKCVVEMRAGRQVNRQMAKQRRQPVVGIGLTRPSNCIWEVGKSTWGEMASGMTTMAQSETAAPTTDKHLGMSDGANPNSCELACWHEKRPARAMQRATDVTCGLRDSFIDSPNKLLHCLFSILTTFNAKQEKKKKRHRRDVCLPQNAGTVLGETWVLFFLLTENRKSPLGWASVIFFFTQYFISYFQENNLYRNCNLSVAGLVLRRSWVFCFFVAFLCKLVITVKVNILGVCRLFCNVK